MFGKPRIELGQPVLFNAAAVLVANAFGLLLFVPVLLSILAMSLMQFSTSSLLIVLLTVLATTFFLPFGFGNSFVTWRVRSIPFHARTEPNVWIVQLTTTPRVRSGWRAVAEDADDIGYLRVTDNELVFHGDAIRLSIPYESIRQAWAENIGVRGLFLYGRRLKLQVEGLAEVAELEFAERGSWVLTTSWRATRAMERGVLGRVANAVPVKK